VEGLDAEAAVSLLERRRGVAAAPSVRQHLLEQTRGNALALLEVPSALSDAQLVGDEPLPQALPLTRQIERVFLDRVRRLAAPTQRLLVVAAADDLESVSVVTRAAEEIGLTRDAFDEAERAGLLSTYGDRFEFKHPLVRSALYEAAPSNERLAAHRALALALAGDAEHADSRAWHLAASSLEPDEQIVSALEEAAARAEARAGHLAAARALERAAALSADDAARGRRLAGAARAASAAGADALAVPLARRAVALADEPTLRGHMARVIAVAGINGGRPGDAVPMLLDSARDLAADQPRLALDVLVECFNAAADAGDYEASQEAARLAAEVEPPLEDEEAVFLSHVIVGFAAMEAGTPATGGEHLEQALAWGGESEDPRHLLYAGAAALWLGDDVRCLRLIDAAVLLARSRGALAALSEALGFRAAQLVYEQRYDGAELAAEEAVRLAGDLRAENNAAMPLNALAHVAAIRGEDDAARRHAERALEIATTNGLAVRAAQSVTAFALIALGRGFWDEALAQYDELLEVRPGFGNKYLSVMTTPDRIEAALRVGRLDVAREALAPYEAWALHSGSRPAQPRLAACRALLAEGEEATEQFEIALGLSADARPFDLARIRLLYGEHLRRERRRADARTQLRSALEGFERLRASPWADRARAELRATGERARRRDPSTIDTLTPQELQIARFVAQGLTNKEVAAQLFLSPRTIDSHLRNVFGKLGITSRMQLTRLPLGEEEEIAAVSGLARA
jgi:DNA-binding CsgD family transcriptional regulator